MVFFNNAICISLFLITFIILNAENSDNTTRFNSLFFSFLIIMRLFMYYKWEIQYLQILVLYYMLWQSLDRVAWEVGELPAAEQPAGQEADVAAVALAGATGRQEEIGSLAAHDRAERMARVAGRRRCLSRKQGAVYRSVQRLPVVVG